MRHVCVYKVRPTREVGGVIGGREMPFHACRRFPVTDHTPETIARAFERSNLAVLVVPNETLAGRIRRHTTRPVVTTMDAAQEYAWPAPEFKSRPKVARPAETDVRWVSSGQRLAAIEKLAPLLPPDVTAIAGVGRSGVSPALAIAELLHLHAYVVDEEANLTISLGNLEWIYAGDFSVSLWERTFVSGDDALMGNKDWTSGANVGWVISTLDPKNLNYNAAAGTRRDIDLQPPFSDGNWHLVTITFNRSANQVISYLDGIAVMTSDISPSGAASLNAGLNTLVGSTGNGLYSAHR